MQFFNDLSSLHNFYSFSVDIVWTLFGRFMHFVYLIYKVHEPTNAVLVIFFVEIFLFLSADENNNIDISTI